MNLRLSPRTLTLILALAAWVGFSLDAHTGAASVKVRFVVPDSRPKLELTADLYRPDGSGPFPGWFYFMIVGALPP